MRTFHLFFQRYIIADDACAPREQQHTQRTQIQWTGLSVLILGLLAHGYAFFDAAFTHDSLNALYADAVENTWKISLGRFIKPVYQTLIRGEFAAPWLIGMLALLWSGLAIFLIVRMFSVQSPVCIALISGTCITNLTFTLTAATYIYDLDTNMLAFLFSTLAAFLWQRKRFVSLLGALCVTMVLGIYQSYVSVCIVLIILLSLAELLNGKPFFPTLTKGITACVMLVLGAAIYALCLAAIRNFTGTSMDTSMGNSLGQLSELNLNGILSACRNTYGIMYAQLIRDWMTIFPLWFIKVSHIALAASAAIPFWAYVRKGVGFKEALLFAVLLLCIPPAVFLSMILSSGDALHQLMLHSLWLLYIFPVLVVYHSPASTTSRTVCISRTAAALMMVILLWGNVRTANALYLIKDMQYDAAKSLMTRVLYRMETSQDYVPGETPVALIGTSPLLPQMPHTERYERLVGVRGNLGERFPEAGYDPQYKLLFFALNTPIVQCSNEAYLSLQNSAEVAQMPLYPKEGCMRIIDGIWVVKLGN